MIERGGRVRAYVVPRTRRPTLYAHISTSVKPASTVDTDDGQVYKELSLHGFEHHRINHSENVSVSGGMHTQNIEGFWSQVERGIKGVCHSVSRTYLQSYVDEYVWRFNHRNDGRVMFFTPASAAATTLEVD